MSDQTPRTVLCRKYQQELEALPSAPMPGPKGEELYKTVSKRAWEEWQALQTMLINEKHLSVRDPEARKYLSEQRERFFDNQDFDQAEGFTPEQVPGADSNPGG